MKETDENSLFGEFPPVATAAWEEQILKDLKGADYQKKLIWQTPEGFPVRPYYRAEDLEGLDYLNGKPGHFPFTRGNHESGNEWKIRQDITDANPVEANMLALDMLAKGVQSIGFNVGEITRIDQMQHLLNGIDLTRVPVHFFQARSYPLILELFVSVIHERGIDPEAVSGSLDFDPVSYLLTHGEYDISADNLAEESVYLITVARKHCPRFRVIQVKGNVIQDAGGNLIQELAFSLNAGLEYLARLTTKGLRSDVIASSMTFTFAIGPSFFPEMAKLRAARLLWSNMLNKYQPDDRDACAMQIHSVTARWDKTIYDPYVNMLRTTTEGISAAMGTTDSMAILPFDIAFEEPTSFASRIARNQQLIFKEESYLNKVSDPAAGAYYPEILTHSMAYHSWKLVQQVEARGGMIACIESGFVQQSVMESRQKKEEDFARRRLLMVGTNQYPNLTEVMLEKQTRKSESPDSLPARFIPLTPFRIAEPMERIRMATESFIANGHHQPVVFLLTFGNLTMLRARAGFATNFFGCAGFRILDHPGFADIHDGVMAAINEKADIVVFCSSDDEYAGMDSSAVARLKEQLPDCICVVAGYPEPVVSRLTEAGINRFIHVRSNLIGELTAYQNQLGIH